MSKPTVLFIADKTTFYKELAAQLKQDDIMVNHPQLALETSTYFQNAQPDLVVVHCPNQDFKEFSLCQEICGLFPGLFISISDMQNTQFQVAMLNLGADASLISLDGLPLIVASIRCLLRRFASKKCVSQLIFDGLVLDKMKRDAFVNDKAVKLSSIEFQLIWSLALQPGCVISRHQIHKDIYNKSYNGYDRGIDLYVSRIRQKIGDNPSSPDYLKTVRGSGYQFVATETQKCSKIPQTQTDTIL